VGWVAGMRPAVVGILLGNRAREQRENESRGGMEEEGKERPKYVSLVRSPVVSGPFSRAPWFCLLDSELGAGLNCKSESLSDRHVRWLPLVSRLQRPRR
jgi:hypothetical protein